MPSLSLKIVQDGGAVTRKVKFDSRMTVKDAHKLVKGKVIVPNDGKEYGLFLRSADDNMSGVWLEDDRTLDYYMLRDGDSLDYICRVRNLRVKLLDDTVKTLQVDEAKSVGELMINVCGRIGITNYDEYGLCHEEEDETDDGKETKEPATGTLTLKRKQQTKDPRDVALEQLSKKLKTDDNVEWLDQHRTLREQGVDAKETLILKRRLFFSDRNVDARDPVQLNLLYVQIRDAILNGRHPVTEQQAADCKVRWINIRDVHRRILKKNLADPSHKSRQYKYEGELNFMKPFYRDVAVVSTEDNGEEKPKEWDDMLFDDNDNTQPTYSDDSDVPMKKAKIVPKRKKTKKKKKDNSYDEDINQSASTVNETQTSQTSELDSTDPVDAFLLSIGATLKTFSPYHLNVAKSKIFNVVQEHDLQQIVQKEHRDTDIKVSTSEALFLD